MAVISSGTSTAVSAAGSLLPPPWGTIVSVAAKLLGTFGGSKTPSVLQGFDVSGSFGSGGFSGSVTAFDQLGNRWAATGETAYLNSLGRDLVTGNSFASRPLADADVDAFVANVGAQPFAVRVGADNTRIPATVADEIASGIRSFFGGATVNAGAAITGTVPMIPGATGSTPAADAGLLTGAQSNGAGAAVAPVASTFGNLEQLVIVVAVASALLWAIKEHG